MFQVDNYYVLAGLNSTGVASSGGYGHVLSQWIATGVYMYMYIY